MKEKGQTKKKGEEELTNTSCDSKGLAIMVQQFIEHNQSSCSSPFKKCSKVP
jgi:hypothetical protein